MNAHVTNKAIDFGFSLALIAGVGVALWWVGGKAVEKITQVAGAAVDAVPDAVNPASDQNFIYSALSSAWDLTDDLSVNGSGSLGTRLYELTHWGG